MSHIFRLYTGGNTTYNDWNENPAFPYVSSSRDTIADPDGASAKNEITSIPSPFARIDLVKNAFKNVTKSKNLDGNTIFHKMVSDALDVGEIFFNIDKLKGKIEIITWDPSIMIQELKDSDNVGHYFLADALEKYMKSDSDTYNFSGLKNIYLLNFVDGPDELNIIGATSPATVFFSSANKLDYVSDAINFGQDRPFDNDFQPLYKRDFEYVKMWFVMRKTIPNFADLFPEVDEYLEQTFRAISDTKKKETLRRLTSTDAGNYKTIDVVAVQQVNTVEVLGYEIFKNEKTVTKNSEMFIKASRGTLKPFVLPVDSGSKYSDLQYTSDKWGKSNSAPYKCEEDDLTKRTLPGDGAISPYLTISDFLEDRIVSVPHKLNTDRFFDGNIEITENKLSYLIPLKNRFFEYFTIEDLRSEMPDGKMMFEMETMAGGSVKVYLRIPISGNNKIKYIEYQRLYYKDRQPEINETTNDGSVVDFDFAGIMMPNVKFSDPDEAIYKIAMVGTYAARYDFSFFNADQALLDIDKECRNTDHSVNYKAETYTIEKKTFEYIQVKDRNGYKGILVPIFKEQSSVNTFEFAIDLGTSNTHIEYKMNDEPQTRAFNYDSSAELITQMFLPNYITFGGANVQEDLLEEYPLIDKDFLPSSVGNDSEFYFPTRTVLACAKQTDWDRNVKPFGLTNIPLTYDKRRNLQYNNYKCNIKWGKGEELRIMESFVDNLMMMIRNMVIKNQGSIKKTKITWFYPISMAPRRLNQFRQTWDDSYNKYFGPNSTNSITESAAPIQYYFRKYSTATNLVNVDIGGGTTDIAFAKDKKIEFVTSFRFAANSLFENSFSEVDTKNGIVDYYKEQLKTLLSSKSKSELVAIFDSPNNVNYSSNMASFLFSLKSNSMVKDMDPKSIDFNYILQVDENFKISFIIFYTAIIYHIAEIIKIKNLEVPRHIAFSGNGSKIIKIITPNTNILSEYTQKIFEMIIGKKSAEGLDILGLDKDSNPKESTCKGGLYGVSNDDDDRDKIVILKATGDKFVSNEDTYDSIDNNYISKVDEATRNFLDFTLNKMPSVFKFDDNFGVSQESIKIARKECYKDISTYLNKGLSQRKEESEGKNTLEETMFFYPIKGMLHNLSLNIFNYLTNKE